ncbi:MAG: glycosyltransferase family 2 protein [Candidatus Sericytochromatia bacterium]
MTRPSDPNVGPGQLADQSMAGLALAAECARLWLALDPAEWQTAWHADLGEQYRQLQAQQLWRQGLMSRDRELLDRAIRRVLANPRDWPAHLVTWLYKRRARALQQELAHAPDEFQQAWNSFCELSGKSLEILDPIRDFKVTVLIPTYQRLKLLQQAVACIQDQTWADWELIIVDDGSQDGTREYCQQLTQTDSRIRAIHKPVNKGLADSMQLLYESARTELVTVLADDDRVMPCCLEKCVALYRQYPWLAMAGGSYWYLYFLPEGKSVSVKQFGPYVPVAQIADPQRELQRCALTNPIFGGGALMRKAILPEVSLTDPFLGEDRYSSWDWLISARCFSDFEVGLTPEVTAAYIDHQLGAHFTQSLNWGPPFMLLLEGMYQAHQELFGPDAFPGWILEFFLERKAGSHLIGNFGVNLKQHRSPQELDAYIARSRWAWESYRRFSQELIPAARKDLPALLTPSTMFGLSEGKVSDLGPDGMPPLLKQLVQSLIPETGSRPTGPPHGA